MANTDIQFANILVSVSTLAKYIGQPIYRSNPSWNELCILLICIHMIIGQMQVILTNQIQAVNATSTEMLSPSCCVSCYSQRHLTSNLATINMTTRSVQRLE